MKITDVPFGMVDWNSVEAKEYPGITGNSYWRVFEQGNIRVRMVDYTPGYMADHWCKRGHVALILEGEFVVEFEDGRKFIVTPGASFHVADEIDAHRVYTKTGAKVFLVD